MTSLYSNTFFLCVLRLSFFHEIKAWSIFCTQEWLKVKSLLQFSLKAQKFLTSKHQLSSSFSKFLWSLEKKLAVRSFCRMTTKFFWGMTSNDLEGRHVFIFSIFYHKQKISCFGHLCTIQPIYETIFSKFDFMEIWSRKSQYPIKYFRKKRFKISTPNAPHIRQDTRKEIINQCERSFL